MAQGGTYRINSVDFPAPQTAWEEQQLGDGLDGIPILGSYRIHRWRWSQLDGGEAASVYSLFNTATAGRDAVTLETDPYDASLASSKYGTYEYQDVIVKSVSRRQRGLPNYSDIEVAFEVYIA